MDGRLAFADRRSHASRSKLSFSGRRVTGVPNMIGVQLDFRGATLEQYDEVAERIGYLPGGPGAPDELSHWVTKTDDGIRVIDVWKSREAFESFAAERVLPLLREFGVVDPPEAQFFEVHNYLAVGGWKH